MDEHYSPFPSDRSSIDEDLPVDLQAIVQRYQSQPVPQPTQEDTARLLTRLLSEETSVELTAAPERWQPLKILAITRWRMRLLGPWFWIASVLLLCLGILLSSLLNTNSTTSALILVVPLAAILSIAHALRTSSEGLRAIEASCPTGFIESMTGLALAIIAFDCLLGILATLFLSLAQWTSFTALLLAWLGPLLLLTAISLPVALRWGTIPAMLIGGMPWLGLAICAALQPFSAVAALFTPSQNTGSLLAHLVSALLGGLILFLLFRYGSKWQYFLLRGETL